MWMGRGRCWPVEAGEVTSGSGYCTSSRSVQQLELTGATFGRNIDRLRRRDLCHRRGRVNVGRGQRRHVQGCSTRMVQTVQAKPIRSLLGEMWMLVVWLVGLGMRMRNSQCGWCGRERTEVSTDVACLSKRLRVHTMNLAWRNMGGGRMSRADRDMRGRRVRPQLLVVSEWKAYRNLVDVNHQRGMLVLRLRW